MQDTAIPKKVLYGKLYAKDEEEDQK